MSLKMNKLCFLSPTLHPAFLPSNYLYLSYAALGLYWKRSNLEWHHMHMSINKYTQSGPQKQRGERHVPRRGASSWSPSKTSIKSRVHVVLLSSPKWSKERVMWLTVGRGEETSKVLANKTSRERDSISDHLLCGFSSREASPLVPLESDRINVFWKCLYGLKCW